MLLLIPFATVLCCALVYEQLGRTNRREALLLGCVFVGAWIAVVTEALSLFGVLRFWPLVSAWIAACVALAAATGWRPVVRAFELRLPGARLSRIEKTMVAYLCALLFLTALLAAVAPPNTWDSMTYHMSRVMHWVQDGSVDFYPTAILRQLHSNPWAEFAILHAQILSGGDHFANFVQWSSMVGCAIGTSAVAREFGADRRGQMLSAVVCASLPMGILQATSTQTDYVTAFWLVCFVHASIKVVRGAGGLHVLGAGSALGLAILTKGTAYVYALPFVLLVAAGILRRQPRRAYWWPPALGILLLLNAGHWHRNYELYGSLLGPGIESGGFRYANDEVSLSALSSNMLRNAGLHLGLPPPYDASIQEAIAEVHTLVLRIDVNDPRTTWPGTVFHVAGLSLSEDQAGNPLHLMLIIAACALYVLSGRQRPRVVSCYVLALIAGFMIFCGYLKFQPWHSRLQLPLFVLWTPFIGWAASRILHGRAVAPVAIACMLGSLPVLLMSPQKPLLSRSNVFEVSRDQQYFVKRATLAQPYFSAAHVLRDLNCHYVGLLLGDDDWEYPLWVLANRPGMRFDHVAVTNVSERLAGSGAPDVPCAILGTQKDRPGEMKVEGTRYRQIWQSQAISVYAMDR